MTLTLDAVDEPLLTSKEVAKMLALSSQTLAYWRMNGLGMPFIKLGRSVRYRRDDVLRHIERSRRTQDAH
jgi:excisionase family DNA binding protein